MTVSNSVVDNNPDLSEEGKNAIGAGSASEDNTLVNPTEPIDQGDSQDPVTAVLGDNDDTATTGSGDDVLSSGGGNDTTSSGGGNDIVSASEGDDEIDAGQGDDVVVGGTGNDVISGGEGDTSGGEGDDTLAGGTGADTYQFGDDSGADRVIGFDSGEGDQVAVSGVEGVSSFSDVNITSDDNGNAVIDLGNGNTVTLEGVSPDEVGEDDIDIS